MTEQNKQSIIGRFKAFLLRFPKVHLLGISCLSVLAIILAAYPLQGQTSSQPLGLVADANYAEPLSDDDIIQLKAISLPDNVFHNEHLNISQDVAIQQSMVVQSGDTLGTLFNQAGLSSHKANQVLAKNSALIRPLKALPIGMNLLFITEGKEQFLQYDYDDVQDVRVKIADEISVDYVEKTLDKEIHHAEGDIYGSFYLSALKSGLSNKTIMNLAKIYQYDIDFALDIRNGDKFKLVYEKRFVDGEQVSDGDILAAEFFVRGKWLTALRFESEPDHIQYVYPDGRTMKRAFLRTPVDFTRISSKFNPNRLHPVFKTKRPHKGVDYAAPTGTPIYAAGDGKISFRGKQKGYGNVVYIQHDSKHVTVYAHMNKFASKSKGDRVRQGELIGYVGSTGWATGPHLHYEFRINGVHKDPLKVTTEITEKLPADDLAEFKAQSVGLLEMLTERKGVIASIAYQPSSS